MRAAEQVVQQREAALLSARAQQNSVLAAQSQVAQAIAGVSQSKEALRTAQANLGQIPINQQATRTALETVRQSEAQERQARATLAGAQSDLSQIPGIRADVPAAQAAVDSARSQLEQQELKPVLCAIVSPVNGVVNTKGIDVGEYASPGTALMNLVALDSVYFEAQVPESQLAQIKVGQAARVTVTAVSNEPVIGYVSEIIPVADQQLRQFRLRITLPEDDKMTPGAFARGLLETASVQNRPTYRPRTSAPRTAEATCSSPKAMARARRSNKRPSPPASRPTAKRKFYKGDVQIGDKVIIGSASFNDGDKVKVESISRSSSASTSSSGGSSGTSSSTSSSSSQSGGRSSGTGSTSSGSSFGRVNV